MCISFAAITQTSAPSPPAEAACSLRLTGATYYVVKADSRADSIRMQLKTASLGLLASQNKVGVPKYDPTNLQAGMVHIGVGNFFRAHLAHYLDELFNKSNDADDLKWGVVGAAVTDYSYSKKRSALQEQDMLYTLCERDGNGFTARVVAPILELLPYDPKFGPLQEKLLQPDISIVSTCITEGGYFLNPATGQFDASNPSIVADAKNPDSPTTVMGLLVQALRQRRDANMAPFTVLCCDNIPHGGDAARSVVVGLAGLQDQELGEWIDENVAFPNAMVDRITPATGAQEREALLKEFGLEDRVPVFCEPFTQWVLEDKFVNNKRPAWEKVGVQFVNDVTPWETMKIRILNGGHASLCYPAALLGLEYVHEAMEHAVIGPFLDCLERTEIIPGVLPVPNQDLVEYWQTIQTRFENPTICDRIDRNCEDGADRQPKFILPPARDSLKAGDRTVEGLALVSAMWCRYCQGTTEAGDTIAPNDKIWDQLTATAAEAKAKPQAWLDMTEIYGATGKDERFCQAFDAALRTVNGEGVEAAMKQYIAKHQQNNPTSAAAAAAA